MRYHVIATLNPGREAALLAAIREGTLGRGTVYHQAILAALRGAVVTGGRVHWIEECYCPIPLQAERADLDPFFTILETTPLETGAGLPEGRPLPDFLSEH